MWESTTYLYAVGGYPDHIHSKKRRRFRLFFFIISQMHSNSTKTILLLLLLPALFSPHLVLAYSPYQSPPGYSPGNVNHPSVPPLVHIKDGKQPSVGVGFVKTTAGKDIWYPIVPPVDTPTLPGRSHFLSRGYTAAKVHDPEPDLRQPGYTIVQDADANWNHYQPGKVPEHVVSQDTLDAVAKSHNLEKLLAQVRLNQRRAAGPGRH